MEKKYKPGEFVAVDNVKDLQELSPLLKGPVKQKETGRSGLTKQVTEFLQWMERISNICWYRNHQALGNVKGRPDFEIIFKQFDSTSYRSETVFIELKSEKGKQSYHQQRQQMRIERAGGKYYLCRSLEEIAAIFQAFGVVNFKIGRTD